jgi:hypothetical protein
MVAPTIPEQAVQDHCVRNIGHKEFVKRQHLHLACQLFCHLHSTLFNGARHLAGYGTFQ